MEILPTLKRDSNGVTSGTFGLRLWSSRLWAQEHGSVRGGIFPGELCTLVVHSCSGNVTRLRHGRTTLAVCLDGPSQLNSRLHLLWKKYLYQHRLQKADVSLEGLEICGDISTSDTEPLLDHQLYFSWAVFRIHYTECAMTKEEDKLVAIQGIAQQFGHALGDQLVAGRWHNRLLEELCWFNHPYRNEPPPRRPTKWRSLTWSWASSNTRVWVSNTTKFYQNCRKKQIWGELVGLDVNTNTSDELSDASLRIRCKPIHAVFEPNASSDNEAVAKLYSILILQNSMMDIQIQRLGNSGFHVHMDDMGWDVTRHVQMTVIQRCPHHTCLRQKVDDEDCENNEDFMNCLEGLLLVPQHGCGDVFERIELFWSSDSPTVVKVLDEHEVTESRIITFI
jgi:hypothetical protein